MRGSKLELAARLLGFAEARFSEQAFPRDTYVEVDPEWFMTSLRDHFGEERLADLLADGAAWTEERAIAEAVSV